jgi:hypothetical protein
MVQNGRKRSEEDDIGKNLDREDIPPLLMNLQDLKKRKSVPA